MRMRRADWQFPAEPRTVGTARREVARSLPGLVGESRDVVLLLTSELVTNAVRYSTGPVGVRLTWDDAHLRIDVSDPSQERPVVRSVDQTAVRGRGLMLVEALAHSWGVDVQQVGKSVWFTLDTRPGAG
ncbi:MAG TPA: ATP-binding protein [Nocardioides sp.]|uniref:ATP-binding protein n=1 Tax=Nocardioides sp. TaxID=35761 RepID=UPI002ED803B6